MKRTIQHIFMIIGLIVATVLGIYGQDLSYFLNEQFPVIELTPSITIITFISIGLYIIIPILSFKMDKEWFRKYFIASVLLGFPTSLFSFFVMAMWIG